MWRIPLGALQSVATVDEQLFQFNYARLHAAWDRNDFGSPAAAASVDCEVHHKVDCRRHGWHHEAVRDVLACQQRKGTHLDHSVAGRVRVHGTHTGDAGIQRDKHVEALGLANLTDDDAAGPHPQSLFDEAAKVDLSGAFKRSLAALKANDVTMREAERKATWFTQVVSGW